MHRFGDNLPSKQIDLAFVEHHGSTIMMDKVIRGAYPQKIMPLSPELHQQIVDSINEGKEQGEELGKEGKELDDFVNGYVQRTYQQRKPNTTKMQLRRPGFVYPDEVKVTNQPLRDAHIRVKAGTAEGEPGEYVDILQGGVHGAVKFPNSRLGHLRDHDAGLKSMQERQVPGYHVSAIQDLSIKLSSNTGESVLLSEAIAARLSEIKTDNKPVRIIWAACRSEQWPKDFNNAMFLQWIREAADARREAADRETHKL